MDNYCSTESQVVQLPSCPRCKTAIRRSLRYGNVIKQQLQHIEKVKEMVNGKQEEIAKIKERLGTRLTDLKKKFDDEIAVNEWQKFDRRLQRITKGLMAAVTENQVNLMERYCIISQKLKVKPQLTLGKSNEEFRSEGMTTFIFYECLYLNSQKRQRKIMI